jgi:hypothetical protein
LALFPGASSSSSSKPSKDLDEIDRAIARLKAGRTKRRAPSTKGSEDLGDDPNVDCRDFIDRCTMVPCASIMVIAK